MQPLGTGQSSLGEGLEQADKQFGVPPRMPGARCTDSARGEAGRAALGRRARGEPGVRPAAPPPPRPPPSRGFSCGAQEAGLASPRTIARGRLPAPGEAGAGPRGREASAPPGVRRESPAPARASAELGVPGSLLAGTEEREPGGGAGVAAAAGARGGARERGREAASERASEGGRR